MRLNIHNTFIGDKIKYHACINNFYFRFNPFLWYQIARISDENTNLNKNRIKTHLISQVIAIKYNFHYRSY